MIGDCVGCFWFEFFDDEVLYGVKLVIDFMMVLVVEVVDVLLVGVLFMGMGCDGVEGMI